MNLRPWILKPSVWAVLILSACAALVSNPRVDVAADDAPSPLSASSGFRYAVSSGADGTIAWIFQPERDGLIVYLPPGVDLLCSGPSDAENAAAWAGRIGGSGRSHRISRSVDRSDTTWVLSRARTLSRPVAFDSARLATSPFRADATGRAPQGRLLVLGPA